MAVGIEALNFFAGTAYVDVEKLAQHRRLDTLRFHNLLMKEKSVALPHEDPVTYAVNASRPIVNALSAAEKDRIELLITCSESGIDFGKSMSTYIHHYLELNRNCRLFEVKQACYAATAGLQMAVNFVLSQTSPGARALVIATDICRLLAGGETANGASGEGSYAEPSLGAGAVAMLVSENPKIFQLDVGASGYYGYEVMDTCRPVPDCEVGDADLSLLSYLDCCEQTFLEYQRRVSNVNYRSSFHYLAFHTPFGGMVKGAHRAIMRKLAGTPPVEIEQDFEKRVMPGIRYCQRVGNIMSGTVFLSLASTIDHAPISNPQRVGCFSYGSGCCSEFYSGVITRGSQEQQQRLGLEHHLSERYELSMEEYERSLHSSSVVRFGTRNAKIDDGLIAGARARYEGKQHLLLREIKEFHREYQWAA